MHDGWVGIAAVLAITISGSAAGQVDRPEPPWRPDELRSQVALDTFVTHADQVDIVVANVASLRLEVLPTVFVDVELPWTSSHRDNRLAGFLTCADNPYQPCGELPSGAYGGLGNPILAARHGDVHDQLGWSVGAGVALPGGLVDDPSWRSALADAQAATFNVDAHRWRRDTVAPFLSWLLDGRIHPWVSLQLGGEVVRHLPTEPEPERVPLPFPSPLDGGSVPRHASVLQNRVGARFRHPTGFGAALHAHTVYVVGDGFLLDSSRCGRDVGCLSVPPSATRGVLFRPGPSVLLAFEPAIAYEGTTWFVRAALRARLRYDFAAGDTLGSSPDFTGRLTFGATFPMQP